MKRTQLLAALGAGAVILVPALVQAGALKNGGPVELTVGGQVNRAVMFVDDGRDTTYRHVDNENASTRFFLHGEGKINAEWTAGAHMEMLLRSNPSNAVSATVESSTNSIEEEIMEVFISSSRFGTVTLGQGSMASDGTAEVDLSGTGVAGYSSIADIAGEFAFTSGGVRSSDTIAGSADNMDGLGKTDRIRYDTPEIGGFVFSASNGPEGTVDVAATYSGKIGATEVSAAAAWYNGSGSANDFEDGFTGSVSALMANGLNLTLAAGTKQAAASGRDDATFMYGKVGYKAKLNTLGATNFAVDYGVYNDIGQNGDDLQTIGLQVVQEIDGTGSSVYGAFRNYSLDRTATNYDDIQAGIVGAFVAF